MVKKKRGRRRREEHIYAVGAVLAPEKLSKLPSVHSAETCKGGVDV
jgi:hypothetical protein